MTVRRILVAVTSADEAKRLLQNAFALAMRLKAHVLVTYAVKFQIPYVVPLRLRSVRSYAEMLNALEIEYNETCKEIGRQCASTAKELGLAVVKRPNGDGPSVQWLDAEKSDDITWQVGRLCDLIVASRPARSRGPEQDLVSEALFGIRRPTLITPHKPIHFERGAMVAWNGSLEASAALERAVDLLDRGHPINVVQIGDGRREAIPGEEAVAYLEAHGFKVVYRPFPEQGAQTGAFILQQATSLGVGVLVAGAYTHSRARESLLGGVTATLMAKAHLPVLFAR